MDINGVFGSLRTLIRVTKDTEKRLTESINSALGSLGEVKTIDSQIMVDQQVLTDVKIVFKQPPKEARDECEVKVSCAMKSYELARREAESGLSRTIDAAIIGIGTVSWLFIDWRRTDDGITCFAHVYIKET